MLRKPLPLLMTFLCVLVMAQTALTQSTEFTFQGRLLDNSLPATGSYDLEFRLFDAATGGTEFGSIASPGVSVTSGVFSVPLDFGNSFDGGPRFIQIGVRPAGSPDPFTVLDPRQPISSAPYAIRSLNAAAAETAANSSQLGGVDAAEYVQDDDPRMTDERPPAPGSANYIQNQSAGPQPLASFDISGTGKAGAVDSATNYRISGQIVLDVAGTNAFVGISAGQNTTGIENVFVGSQAGQLNTGGSGNTFVGTFAGQANTASNNTFLGKSAGSSNTTGGGNVFVGESSGAANTTGTGNSFLGLGSGRNNTTGGQNSFFGIDAGRENVSGGGNSFFGWHAGENNTTGANSFFGSQAGRATNTGFQNTFVGFVSGQENIEGTGNTFVGAFSGRSNTASSNTFIGQASGLRTTIGARNSFLGMQSGLNNVDGERNTFIGAGAGSENTSGNANVFVGDSAGSSNTVSLQNAFFGVSSGSNNLTGNNNTFLGHQSGSQNTSGSNNVALGSGSGFSSGALSFATAIGSGTQVSTSNTIQLGRGSAADSVLIPGNLQVNGSIIGSLPGGSSNYIQNGLAVQSGSNFNISGIGVADRLHATSFWSETMRVFHTPGNSNTIVGVSAGPDTGGGGGFNSFFGYRAGLATTTGARNAIFGAHAGDGTSTGNENAFFGYDAGTNNSSGTRNVFLGYASGNSNQIGVNNTFVGQLAGSQNVTGNNNAAFGSGSGFTSGGLSFATAIGPGTRVSTNNTIQLGRITREEQVLIPGNLELRGANGANWEFGAKKMRLGDCNGFVGIFYTNDANETVCNAGGVSLNGSRLDLRARTNGEVRVGNGSIRVFGSLVYVSKAAGGGNQVCSVLTPGPEGPLIEVFSVCSSSIRYKTNVLDYGQSLSLIDRLRPVSFDWISDGKHDVGLIAEEVAAVEPLLATYNEKGEVEGVKYDRIGVVLINVVKEQQEQIEAQQRQIEALKAIVCELKPGSAACK